MAVRVRSIAQSNDPLQQPIPLGGGEFQIAPGLGIEHQGFAAVHDRGHIQGHARMVVEGLGVAHVAQQPTDGLQGERQLRQSKAIEAGQVVVLEQSGFGLGLAEGGAAHRCEGNPIGAPGRCRIVATPEQFGGLQLGELLMQAITAFALHHLHIAGAHIGLGEAPAEWLLLVARFPPPPQPTSCCGRALSMPSSSTVPGVSTRVMSRLSSAPLAGVVSS
jgi:hypothetical protein